jgi:DNA polymerase-3 subunit delta
LKSNKSSTESYLSIKKELSTGVIKPIYYICGEETFFVDALQNDLMVLVPQDLRDFNFDLYYGNETIISKVISAAKSFPMMSDRRLVVLRDFQGLLDRTKSSLTDEEVAGTMGGMSVLEELSQYIEKPNPSTVLIIIDKKKPAGNTKFGMLLSKSNHVVLAHFDAINEDQLPDWIISWFKNKHNRDISPKAAHLLAGRTGSDLNLLSTEIDKLCTFKSTNEEISEDDIEELVHISREINVFELKEAIINRDLTKSLLFSEQMLHNSKTTDVGEILRLIAFFYSYYTNIWQIQRLTQKGIASKDIKSKVGIASDFYFNNLVRESKKINPSHIPMIFEALLDADKSLKGNRSLEIKDTLYILIKRIIG